MGMDWDLCWISRFLFVTQYMVTLADIGFCVFFFLFYIVYYLGGFARRKNRIWPHF